MLLGDFVREERKKRYYSQKDLAELCGCLPAYITKIERSDKIPIKHDILKSLSDVLRCDYRKLVFFALLDRFDFAISINCEFMEKEWDKSIKLLVKKMEKILKES